MNISYQLTNSLTFLRYTTSQCRPIYSLEVNAIRKLLKKHSFFKLAYIVTKEFIYVGQIGLLVNL